MSKIHCRVPQGVTLGFPIPAIIPSALVTRLLRRHAVEDALLKDSGDHPIRARDAAPAASRGEGSSAS
jgi:hypothetical protein